MLQLSAWGVSWQDLKDMFKPFGNVIYADIATQGGQAGAKSFGWGRVKFATNASRNQAIQSMNGVNCQGRNLEVRMDAKENGPREIPSGHACYCGNLPWTVTWQQMKDLFKSFGPVSHAEIATQGGVEGGRSQGWGLVYFENARDRDQAIVQLNGTDWDGRAIEVRLDQKQAANQGGGGGPAGMGGGVPSASAAGAWLASSSKPSTSPNHVHGSRGSGSFPASSTGIATWARFTGSIM